MKPMSIKKHAKGVLKYRNRAKIIEIEAASRQTVVVFFMNDFFFFLCTVNLPFDLFAQLQNLYSKIHRKIRELTFCH